MEERYQEIISALQEEIRVLKEELAQMRNARDVRCSAPVPK